MLTLFSDITVMIRRSSSGRLYEITDGELIRLMGADVYSLKHLSRGGEIFQGNR